MSAPSIRTQIESMTANRNNCKEEHDMSTPTTPGESKLNGAIHDVKTTLEVLEMKLAAGIDNIKTIVSGSLRLKTTATILGSLALGAILMTATAQPFGTTYADEPSRPMVINESVIDRGDDNLSSDAWMQDAPFYEDFSEVGKIEIRGVSLELLGASADAWMQDSPFYEDLSAVGRIEVGGIYLELLNAPADAWMQDSPFYQDFSAVGKIEIQGASLELLGASADTWMNDSPFYEDF